MKLPQAKQSRVEKGKILSYLLNFSHPDGGSKAKFFSLFGFSAKEWQVLSEALCQHGKNSDVSESVESEFGTRYTVEGVLKTPDGRNPNLRSIWLIEKSGREPRLITAYPIGGKK